MKKTYISPELTEVKLQNCMITQSADPKDITVDPNEQSPSMDSKGWGAGLAPAED